MNGRWLYARQRDPQAPCCLDEARPDPVRVCRRCGYRRHAAGVMPRYQMCDPSHETHRSHHESHDGRTNDEQGRGKP